jgi:hypothetical protein
MLLRAIPVGWRLEENPGEWGHGRHLDHQPAGVARQGRRAGPGGLGHHHHRTAALGRREWKHVHSTTTRVRRRPPRLNPVPAPPTTTQPAAAGQEGCDSIQSRWPATSEPFHAAPASQRP